MKLLCLVEIMIKSQSILGDKWLIWLLKKKKVIMRNLTS